MRSRFVFLILVTVATLAVTWSGRRLWLAEQELELDSATSVTLADQARRVILLRNQHERVADRKRPEQDVIARVNAALAEAGLSTKTLGSVRPEHDAAVPGASHGSQRVYRRQSVRVDLRRMEVEDLGTFLAVWRQSQLLWTPTRIELTHVRETADPALFDVSVVVTATYLSDTTS